MHEGDSMNHSCPACQMDLDFQGWDGDLASFEICPHCGIQFGYNDALPEKRRLIHELWRAAWIANGRKRLSNEQERDVILAARGS
jgi:Zn ribbon nucleic-acid-binding protein